MKAVMLETYLVGVERPLGDDDDYVVVTDDYEGFGPGLLATYPVEKVDAKSVAQAGWDYAYRRGLFPIRAIVNLPDEYSEWWLTEEGCEKLEE
jgi:hypothetical protein